MNLLARSGPLLHRKGHRGVHSTCYEDYFKRFSRVPSSWGRDRLYFCPTDRVAGVQKVHNGPSGERAGRGAEGAQWPVRREGWLGCRRCTMARQARGPARRRFAGGTRQVSSAASPFSTRASRVSPERLHATEGAPVRSASPLSSLPTFPQHILS